MNVLHEHKETVTKAIFRRENGPTLKQVISSSNDGLIMAWSLRPNARPNKFVGHTDTICDVDINPEGDRLASASRDCTVRVWKNAASAQCTVMKGHSAPVKSI
jgi:WD40 repeat protein